MTKDEALRLALRALQDYERNTKGVMIPQTQVRGDDAITAIKAALEEKDEPIVYEFSCCQCGHTQEEEL